MVVVSLLCGLGGFCMAVVAIRRRRHALAARWWPTVRGVVRDSNIVLIAGEVRAGGQPAHLAHVTYEYEVGDHTYRGDCISEGMREYESRSYPEALALRYSPGNVMDVRYHPVNHSRSTLEIHPRGAGVLVALAALVMLAVSTLTMLFAAVTTFAGTAG